MEPQRKMKIEFEQRLRGILAEHPNADPKKVKAALRALINGKLKPRTKESLEDYYDEEIARQAAAAGLSPEEFAELESEAQREIQAELAASEGERSAEEADDWWERHLPDNAAGTTGEGGPEGQGPPLTTAPGFNEALVRKTREPRIKLPEMQALPG